MADYGVIPVDMTTHVETQAFGENPASYAKFIVGGRPLQGHNGIDWAPLDGQPKPFWPCADGTVEYIGFDPLGFGNYMKVRHDWGYSLYAHASKLLVKTLDRVRAPTMSTPGTTLGMTGDTGNVWSTPGNSAVHLHFGVYPLGASKSNGFGGAVDPKNGLIRLFQIGSASGSVGIDDKPLQEGWAVVVASAGLKLRPEASVTGHEFYAVLPVGSRLKVTGVTAVTGGTRWRRVEAWVAESQDGVPFLRGA